MDRVFYQRTDIANPEQDLALLRKGDFAEFYFKKGSILTTFGRIVPEELVLDIRFNKEGLESIEEMTIDEKREIMYKHLGGIGKSEFDPDDLKKLDKIKNFIGYLEGYGVQELIKSAPGYFVDRREDEILVAPHLPTIFTDYDALTDKMVMALGVDFPYRITPSTLEGFLLISENNRISER